MNAKQRDIVQWLQEQEREEVLKNPPAPKPPLDQPTIHWTELSEATPGHRGATEWNFYRKQVGRLLGEGHEGRWVLIKGEEIFGIWDTEQEAKAARAQRFMMQDVLLRQILEREPVLRGGGYHRTWHA
ncbi:MAG: hypothetical protein K2R98_05865 [Gemmataceae bacterium]|nr:hypothetical protein [Gemmataceae bacterium]